MIRKIAMAGAAGVIALSGLAVTGGTASAAKPNITAGAGSSVDCNFLPATAKLKPALKDNWIAADHQGDSNASVRALPNTTFAANGPVTVSSKPKTESCTGNVTDGTNTAAILSAKITLTNDPANPGSASPATCANLVVPDPANPSTARYNVVIQWKATTAKIANTAITGAEISSAGGNFTVSGGTITGSFAGGTASTTSSPDSATVGAFLSSTALQPNLVSSSQTNGGACQPSLKGKTKNGVTTYTLKAAKGIKKVGLADGDLTISR